MQLTFEPSRLTGFAILALAGATALSVGACSSSNDAKSPDKSSATSSAAPANGKDLVQGLIASVSGNSVQVTEKTGAATLEVSPSTSITELTNAQLTDVAAGNCVTVTFKPAPDPGGAATAVAVQVNPPGANGKCPQPKNAQPPTVIGTVASVADNTISVTTADANGNPSQTDATLTDKTRYTKGAVETSQAIADGKCINAVGTKDGGGKLQAKVVVLAPTTNGGCPQFGVKGPSH